MKEIVKITYSGVEIEYQEETNKWRFELRGREHKTDSLTDAKIAIDKPEPVKKQKFERIAAWQRSHSWSETIFHKVYVTSIAESDYSGRIQVWVVKDSNGERSKEPSETIIAANAENDMLMIEYSNLDKKIQQAEKRKSNIYKTFDKVTSLLPKDTDL
jgi:hypothetical protein